MQGHGELSTKADQHLVCTGRVGAALRVVYGHSKDKARPRGGARHGETEGRVLLPRQVLLGWLLLGASGCYVMHEVNVLSHSKTTSGT